MSGKVSGGQSFLASIQNLLIFAIFKSPLNLNLIRHWSENWCPGYLKHALSSSEIHLAAAKSLEIIGHVTNCCKRPITRYCNAELQTTTQTLRATKYSIESTYSDLPCDLKVNRGKLALINRPWKCKKGKDR